MLLLNYSYRFFFSFCCLTLKMVKKKKTLPVLKYSAVPCWKTSQFYISPFSHLHSLTLSLSLALSHSLSLRCAVPPPTHWLKCSVGQGDASFFFFFVLEANTWWCHQLGCEWAASPSSLGKSRLSCGCTTRGKPELSSGNRLPSPLQKLPFQGCSQITDFDRNRFNKVSYATATVCAAAADVAAAVAARRRGKKNLFLHMNIHMLTH